MSELPHFNKTAKQLQEKWRNLDKIYRDNKKKSTTSGSGKVTWPYFDDIDSEMRDRADISLKGISNIGGEFEAPLLVYVYSMCIIIIISIIIQFCFGHGR